MKVGILTFHYAHNYGAVLQAYALKEKLRQLGYDVCILNYRNEFIEWRYKNKLNSIRNIRNQKRVYSLKECMEEKRRRGKFNQFIEQILLEKQSKYFTMQDLSHTELDILITGSDQIWTSWLTDGYDPVYFLDFPINAKRVAYAASMHDINISGEEKEYLKKALKQYDAISVREKEVEEFLEKLCEVEIETTIDPTLLLGLEDYYQLEEIVQKPDNYILVYYLYEDNTLRQKAQELAAYYKAEVLELHYVGYHRHSDCIQKSDVGPGEFLSYIKKAKCVLTNSFHGIIFSIIYHKQFWAVYEKDVRKSNLLLRLGLQSRRVYQEKFVEADINYEKVDLEIMQLKKEAIMYLKKALAYVRE